MVAFKRRVRQLMAGYGFQEVVNFSLTSQDVMGKLRPDGESRIKPVKLANPLSSEQDCLRTSLRSGILKALADNRRHEEGAIRLFELGRVYRQRKETELPYEPEMLSVVLSNSTISGGWKAGQETFDFYYAKGLMEALLSALGITADYQVGEDEGLRPGSQAFVVVENIPLGVIGELHPKVAHAFELEGPVFVCEINLTSLFRHCEGHGEYHPVPRYPAIVRDLAIVVENKVTHKLIAEIIAGFPLVKDVQLFDVYSGKQVGEGKKSLAYRLTFQSAEQTLTDEEANKVQQQILDKLSSKLGATLRS
jgi:phenylalanyl-tRNA synthetase beta chain